MRVTLDVIRGSFEPARANARTVAALTDNPGCTRRRIIDAARVRAYELAERLGHPVTRGQSPFAITSGNRFERRLKEGSDYKLLVEVLRPFVELPETGLKVADLGHAKGIKVGKAWLEARAKQTDDILVQIARRDSTAPHIVDHPVIVFDLAGTSVFLEPDALAFRVGAQLQLVEIKSYAIIDGQADPAKVSATGGQSAVYLLALRAVLARLGFDPDMLRWSVILVAPKNFGRAPVAHEVPLRKKAMALERVLRTAPRPRLAASGSNRRSRSSRCDTCPSACRAVTWGAAAANRPSPRMIRRGSGASRATCWPASRRLRTRSGSRPVDRGQAKATLPTSHGHCAPRIAPSSEPARWPRLLAGSRR